MNEFSGQNLKPTEEAAYHAGGGVWYEHLQGFMSGAAYGALEMLSVGGCVGSAEGLMLVTVCI